MAMVVVVAMLLYPPYLFAIQIRVIDTSEICMEIASVDWSQIPGAQNIGPQEDEKSELQWQSCASVFKEHVKHSIRFFFCRRRINLYFIDFYSPHADCLATAKYLVPK